MAISEATKLIAYRQVGGEEDGLLALISPTLECLAEHSIDEIARKDVPEGLPYKIIDVSDLPEDPTFREAWGIDDSEFTDGVGALGSTFDGV